MDLGTFLGGRQAFVAGWGATERGPDTQVLQQVRVPYVTRDECNPHYNNALLTEQVRERKRTGEVRRKVRKRWPKENGGEDR